MLLCAHILIAYHVIVVVYTANQQPLQPVCISLYGILEVAWKSRYCPTCYGPLKPVCNKLFTVLVLAGTQATLALIHAVTTSTFGHVSGNITLILGWIRLHVSSILPFVNIKTSQSNIHSGWPISILCPRVWSRSEDTVWAWLMLPGQWSWGWLASNRTWHYETASVVNIIWIKHLAWLSLCVMATTLPLIVFRMFTTACCFHSANDAHWANDVCRFQSLPTRGNAAEQNKPSARFCF